MIPEVDLSDFKPLCSVPGHGSDIPELNHLHDSGEATHYITMWCPHCEQVSMVHMACLTSASELDTSIHSGTEFAFKCDICRSWSSTNQMQFEIGRI